MSQGDQRTITSYANDLSDITLNRNQLNRLIWGDNILLCKRCYHPVSKRRSELVYIDPPFWTNENYYADIEIGEAEITRASRSLSVWLTRTFGRGESIPFFDMLYPRIQLIRRLLAEDGSLFLLSILV